MWFYVLYGFGGPKNKAPWVVIGIILSTMVRDRKKDSLVKMGVFGYFDHRPLVVIMMMCRTMDHLWHLQCLVDWCSAWATSQCSIHLHLSASHWLKLCQLVWRLWLVSSSVLCTRGFCCSNFFVHSFLFSKGILSLCGTYIVQGLFTNMKGNCHFQ